jgi:hypothetical protein
MKLFSSGDLIARKCQNLEPTRDKIVKYTDYILDANLWTYKNKCLKRSLILYYYLRKLGMNVHICFGVRHNSQTLNGKSKEKLEGHAWLLYNGDIFLETNIAETKTYKMTYCFPETKDHLQENGIKTNIEGLM